MTVINAIGSLPGLGRLVVQSLIESPEPMEKDQLRAQLLPTPLQTGKDPFSNLEKTLSVLKDIGITSETGGLISLSGEAATFLQNSPLTQARYRRLLQHFVFASIDVDPWKIGANDTLTSGSKDINRALSWSLAQDVRSTLTWDKQDGGMTSAQVLQKEHLPNAPDLQPFSNDTRWGTFVRWSIALGCAQPALVGAGIYPDATVAIRDVVLDMPPGRVGVDNFLDEIAARLPVLRGGVVQASFLELSNIDPDPDSARGDLDSTLAQAILALEEESVIDILPLEADAPSRTIGLDNLSRRVTHLQIKEAVGK